MVPEKAVHTQWPRERSFGRQDGAKAGASFRFQWKAPPEIADDAQGELKQPVEIPPNGLLRLRRLPRLEDALERRLVQHRHTKRLRLRELGASSSTSNHKARAL